MSEPKFLRLPDEEPEPSEVEGMAAFLPDDDYEDSGIPGDQLNDPYPEEDEN